MAECNDLFHDFHQKIRILKSKRDKMKASKNALRQVIIKYFKEHHPEYVPKFYIQGSYKIRNGIRYKDETADLDDGVYFEKKPDGTDAVSATQLQSWVYDAVKDHTDGGAKHLKKCIRVIYKGEYHIDLPVLYTEENDKHFKLAVKNIGWQEDDPKEFVDWFIEKNDDNDQLKRISKYLKAWGNFIEHDMPPGLCMTILAQRNISLNDSDDICLKDTLKAIYDALENKWECIMPTTPKDDLFAGYDSIFKSNFLKSLKNFVDDSQKAVDTESKSDASNLWRKHLGNRFPEFVEEKKKSSDESAALASVAIASKPYSE